MKDKETIAMGFNLSGIMCLMLGGALAGITFTKSLQWVALILLSVGTVVGMIGLILTFKPDKEDSIPEQKFGKIVIIFSIIALVVLSGYILIYYFQPKNYDDPINHVTNRVDFLFGGESSNNNISMEYYLEIDGNGSHWTDFIGGDQIYTINFNFTQAATLYARYICAGYWDLFDRVEFGPDNNPAGIHDFSNAIGYDFIHKPESINTTVYASETAIENYSGQYIPHLGIKFTLSNNTTLVTKSLYDTLENYIEDPLNHRFVPGIWIQFNRTIDSNRRLIIDPIPEQHFCIVHNECVFFTYDGWILNENTMLSFQMANSSFGINYVGFGYYDSTNDLFFEANIFLQIIWLKMVVNELTWIEFSLSSQITICTNGTCNEYTCINDNCSSILEGY